PPLCALLSCVPPCSPVCFSLLTRPPPRSTLFPYTTLFRSRRKRPWNPTRLRRPKICRISFRHRRADPLQTGRRQQLRAPLPFRRDRKSTRLNSSHVEISYAVFCLKKKKN